MKNKIIIIVLLIIITILTINILSRNTYDVNNDGKVNSKDLLDLRNYLIEKESEK